MAPTLEQWRWRIGNDTGASSIAIWHAITGEPGLDRYINCVPHDSSDFGRCIRLIREFGWEGKMRQMNDVSPTWNALAVNWPALTKMFDKGDHGGVNKRLQHIHDEFDRLPAEEDWLVKESVLFPNELKKRMDALVNAEEDEISVEEEVKGRKELWNLVDLLRAHPDLREEFVDALFEEEG